MKTLIQFINDVLLPLVSRFYWLGIVSVVFFVGTLIAIPIIITKLPDDYFSRSHHHLFLPHIPQIVRIGLIAIKNILGVIFFLSGILMLFLPGQGILTIFIGISFMNFPGKRRMEQKLISIHAVYKGTTWLRHKAGREPLELPPECIPPVPG